VVPPSSPTLRRGSTESKAVSASTAVELILHRLNLAAFWALIPIVGFVVWATVATPYDNSPPIRSDGLGYFAWTEAIIEGNFDFCQWPSLETVDAISVHDPIDPARCENKYTPGLALLRFPVEGPLAAMQSQGKGTDLIVGDAEEKASLWLGALALVITSLLVLATLRALGVYPLVANVVTLAGCFGTGLFHYATYDSSFTHVYSAALVAGLVFLAISARARGRPPNPVLLFLLALFIALVREPDIPVLLALLVAWLIWQVKPLPAPERLRAGALGALPILAALAAVAIFQLLYNRWSSGAWTLSSYGQEPFTIGAFHEPGVLLSYDRGLFVWYPVLGVMLGVALWRRPSRQWGIVGAVLVAVLTALYGSWHSWDLGGGFGHRGFVDVVPFLIVAGGVGLSTLGKFSRTVMIGAIAICALATVELMAGYWDGSIPIANTTMHQYWQHVTGADSLLNFHLGRDALF
jgi:hypothetical protein